MSAALPPRDRDWHPPALAPDYKSSRLRAPTQKLLRLPSTISEETGPVFGHDTLGPLDADLITNFAASGEMALGPRRCIRGTVRDQNGRPVAGVLVEVWQANAAGRYRHVNEGYLAPLDPNFGGCGRMITDAEGAYQFMTVQPAAYPWPNAPNAWRPAHIHFSLSGPAFGQRLITQMYFEGDPLIPLCPIVQAIPSGKAVEQLVARLDMPHSESMDYLTYRFDITLRGGVQTPFENKMEGM